MQKKIEICYQKKVKKIYTKKEFNKINREKVNK
jgi:hypothetical protein